MTLSQDVGGGSVRNGERNSLARIPLRWMVRECFKCNSGIIFDAHMLNHEIGLDINSIFKAPDPMAPETHHLDTPGTGQIRGFSFLKVPVAVFSGLSLPFRWTWGKLKGLRLRRSPQIAFSIDVERFKYEGEAQEELKDALSPVYDQLKVHWYWTLMEWIPCEWLPATLTHRRS